MIHNDTGLEEEKPAPRSHEHSARPASRRVMTPPMQRSIAIVALLGMVLVTALAVAYTGDSGPGRFDRWVQSSVDHAPSTAWAVAFLVDSLGEPIGVTLMTAAVAALCFVLGRHRLAVVAIAGTILTGAATTLLKKLVDRRIHDEFLSFPSGHTAVAVVLALVLALLLIDLLRTSWPVGTLCVLAMSLTGGVVMAWSQIILGAHYPTDTVGGFGCALAVGSATAWLTDKVADTRLLGLAI